jgi:hypothetical protein
MRLKVTRCFLIAAILCLAGVIAACNPVRTKRPYTLNDRYKTLNLSHRKLIVVFPTEARIIVNNPADVIDDFGGMNAKPEARIGKFYFPEFFKSFKSFASGDSVAEFDQACPGVLWDSLPKRQIDLKTDLDSAEIGYSIPDTSFIREKRLDSAVVVVIQDINFKRNNFHIEYYWDDRTRKPANLEATVRLVIYDYAMNAPIFFGVIREQTEFHFSMKRQHWDESAHALGKKIVMAARCL